MLSSSLLPVLALAAGVSANNAVHDNPSNVNIGLTEHGSDWLWAVFAIMLVSDIAFIAWHRKTSRAARLANTQAGVGGVGATGLNNGVGAANNGTGVAGYNNNNGHNNGQSRVFHNLAVIILTTATIAYFSMASNLGQTGIRTEFGSAGTRSIWYARYILWTIATPLLLLELVLATALPLSDIINLMFFQLALIVTRLLGALVTSQYKWGYYALSLAFMFYVIYLLLVPSRRSAGLFSDHHRGPFTRGAGYISFLWLLYPICWGLAEGSNKLSVTGEMIFYGILDILIFPVFLFYHVHTLSRLNLTNHGFTGFQRGSGYGGGAYGGGQGYNEKGLAAHGAGPAGTVPMSGQNTASTGAGGGAPVTHTHGDLGRNV